MNGLLLTIPLVLALIALVLGAVRSIATAWFHHRMRLELLRKLEKHPELVHSPEDAQDLYYRLASTPAADPQDYTLTGIVLCGIGAGCVILGRVWRIGQIAAGVYWGGMACLFLGAALALLGLVVMLIARNAGIGPENGARSGVGRSDGLSSGQGGGSRRDNPARSGPAGRR